MANDEKGTPLSSNSKIKTFLHERWKWLTAGTGSIILILVVQFVDLSGYTLKDFIKKEPLPTQEVQTPSAETKDNARTIDELKAAKPPLPPPSKNSVKIQVEDQGKVGNIITGDSNKIEIKQDF